MIEFCLECFIDSICGDISVDIIVSPAELSNFGRIYFSAVISFFGRLKEVSRGEFGETLESPPEENVVS